MSNINFNEYFGIQDLETDHINIPLDEDLKAFICPYQIFNSSHLTAVQVKARHDVFFKYVTTDLINPESEKEAITFLSNLSEPNEYHLGYSKSNKGKGIAKEKAGKIYTSLSDHIFVKNNITITHEARHILLNVEGIGQDNMSDIISDIAKDIFAEFTLNQCEKYGITTEPYKVKYFCQENLTWKVKEMYLPYYNGKPIILLPKSILSSSRSYPERYNYHCCVNNIVPKIQKRELHIDNHNDYIKQYKTQEKVLHNKVFKDFKKPKGSLYLFIQEYPNSLLEFDEYVKYNLPCYSEIS